MFKVSQDIQLTNKNVGNNNNVFGKYQKSEENDSYRINEKTIFVSPELTDTKILEILHFPEHPIKTNQDIDFVIKKNGIRGNVELKLETPNGNVTTIPLEILDPDRLGVRLHPILEGLYKVHLKCNSVDLPNSPYIIVAETDIENGKSKTKLPVFESDATKVIYRSDGLKRIELNVKNEFIIDASNAGNNILLVGICGPHGQCDEVTIKHMGRNVYNITYQVQETGEYVIAVKWGDDHIPKSPFHLETI